MRNSFVVLVLLSLFLVTANAQTNRLTSYQGYITQNGKPINGSHSIKVSIYDDSTASGRLLYTETKTDSVANGVFSVYLGSVNAIPDSIAAMPNLFVGIGIDGGTELMPRTPIGTVITAMRSKSAGIADSITGTLPVAHGGTGQSNALNTGGVIFAASPSAMSSTTAGKAGQVLTATSNNGFSWVMPDYVPSGALIAFGDANPRAGYTYTGAVEIHEGWTTLSSAGATAEAGAAAATLGGKLYILGGYNYPIGGTNINVQVYDPQTDSWTLKAPMIHPPGSSVAAVTIGSKIYVIGRDFG